MLDYFVKKENILKSTIFFTIIITLLSLSVTLVFSILFFSSIYAEAVFSSVAMPVIIFPVLLYSFFKVHFKINDLKKKLYTNSRKDLQTDTWNRHYFLELAEREFFIAKRYKDFFSILMCEIDNIKAINEKYGHSAGDKMINDFAQILNTNIRTTDAVARYDSKKFVLLLPKIDACSAMTAVERLKKIIEESSVFIADDEIKYAITLGAATFDEEMSDLKDLLLKAEENL